jgi:ribonuclease P protein component
VETAELPVVDRLRKRRDFLAAAKAARAGVPAFLLQARDRGDAGEVRVGFTVTKKTGGAVVRNRIRRRLREAVRRVLPGRGRPGFDYVLVARAEALRAPFSALVGDLERAVSRVNAPGKPKSRPKLSTVPRPESPGVDAAADGGHSQ